MMLRKNDPVAARLNEAHQEFLADLEVLQSALAPAARAELLTLRQHLARTLDHLIRHFRLDEKTEPAGELVQQKPGLQPNVRKIREERATLRAALEALIDDAHHAASFDDALKQKVAAWVKAVEVHEMHEKELVQDAVNLDVGTKD